MENTKTAFIGKSRHKIHCNSIRVVDNGTVINGIIEGSEQGYDVQIAFIPFSEEVILQQKSND